MKFPLRSLSNVRFSARKGHFEMLGKKKERTLSVSTVKSFAQTLRMIAEMADDHGRQMLDSSLGPMFASEEVNAYNVATEGWLDHRSLFTRLHRPLIPVRSRTQVPEISEAVTLARPLH